MRLTKITHDLLRKRLVVTARKDHRVVINHQALINFASNDYLNIATHPDVEKAAIAGIETYGVGSSSAACISGFYAPHHALEEAFAAFLKRERAILFNSGYHANLGVLTALLSRGDAALADKCAHASILDALLLSRAKGYRFKHNDVNHAEYLLTRHAPVRTLITEGVFSMEGSISPLSELTKLTENKETFLILDDAHGVGVLGPEGGGCCDYFHLTAKEIPCLIAPLGKAFGSMGAIVAGDADLIEHILQSARAYRYTTALPPAIASAALKALEIIKQEHWRREKLNSLIRFFIKAAHERQLPLISTDLTPIKCIKIGNNILTLKLQKQLMSQGFLVGAIRPPTVSIAQLRLSLNCLHTEEHIEQLLDEIKKYYDTSECV